MSLQTKRRSTRNWSDIAKGFGGLVAVLALAVGVPIALIAWVGWPLPEQMTSIDQVTSALRDRYIPDAFLIKALAVVCWLVWIELMASLIVEAVAYIRGRQAGRVPLAGGAQRAAARLVATVALLGALVGTKGLPGMIRQPLTPIATNAPVMMIDEEAPPKDRVSMAPSPALAEAPPPIYQVQRRDTLWDIAERHLGDPFRWVEIYEMSKDLPQPDGRTLTDPDLIYAGWLVRLPADAVGLAQQPAPVPTPPPASAATQPDVKTGGGGPFGDALPPVPTGDEVGMVLLDDGSGSGGSGPEVLVAPPAAPNPAAYDPAGMVLLPVELAGGDPSSADPPAEVAEPPTDDDRSLAPPARVPE